MVRLILCLSLLVLTACSPYAAKTEDDILAEEQYRMVTGTKDLVDPVHGKRTGFWYGSVLGEAANGIAFLHGFEDGFFSASMNLNVEPAPNGSRYIVVLQSNEGRTIEMGVLESLFDDARHTVKFETSEEIAAFLTVNVFLVTGTTRELIAEGTLKQPPEGTW